LQNLDATLNLRNQDNVARRVLWLQIAPVLLPWTGVKIWSPKGARTTEVKILQPDSTFFKVLPGKGRKPDQTDNKAG